MFWGDGEEAKVKRGIHERKFCNQKQPIIPPPNQTQFETTTTENIYSYTDKSITKHINE